MGLNRVIKRRNKTSGKYVKNGSSSLAVRDI